MFQSTLQSIFAIVLPRPSFKVTPSQPDPVYYTATALWTYNLNPKASFSNFNVSTTKFSETPRGSDSVNILASASSNICSLSRYHSNSTCCCSCSCPYNLSSSSLSVQNTELRLLNAVATSLLESSSPRSSSSTSKVTRRHSTGSWNSALRLKTHKHMHIPNAAQESQHSSTPNSKQLRRTSKRIMSSCSTSSNQIASLDSFDSPFKFKSKARPLEFLGTAKRSFAMYDPESSLSSCSSFDASDNEGTYPSTPVPFPLSSPAPIDSLPRLSQAFSENIPSAFELSPIMEDPSVFEDMDDILACYSDSPTLGRINESHTHFEFAFDDADWEAEAIESELKSDASDTDSPNNEPKRTRRMSFALRTTERGHDPLLAGANTENNAYKDLLSPPSLTLTFPTPEMQDTSRLPEPVPLVAEPDHLLPFSMPQTPPASTRRSLDRNRDHLVPPTPMPSLPRCVSCGFGFSFDITGSTDMVHTRVDPCGKCQAQWERCQKWYGKRGWGVEENVEEATFQAADPKTEKVLKRASRRLSQIVESVFMSDRKSQRLSAQVSSKRTSKLISFMDRVHPKENTRNPSKDEFASAGNLADPAFLEEFGTRVRDYGDTSRSRIHDFQSPSPDVIQKKKMFKLFRSFSQSTTAFNLKKKNGLRSERRRSFLDLGTSGLKHRRASYRRSYSGRPSQRL